MTCDANLNPRSKLQLIKEPNILGSRLIPNVYVELFNDLLLALRADI